MIRPFLLAAALLALAAPLHAGQYTLLIHEAPAELAKRNDPGAAGTAYWQGFTTAGGQLARAGALRGGAALEPSSSPDARGLILGGYFVIEAPDAATARQLADSLPAARGGHIDVIAHAATKTSM